MSKPEHDPSELVRLAKLVKAMRSVQKRYYAGDHSTATLTTAKDLERRVDKAVDWVLDHRQPRQTMLFADVQDEPTKGPYGKPT